MSAPNRIAPQRILVVDDEASVLEAVKLLLAFDGHTVVTAPNGPAALSKLEPDQFSLVITDYCMPQMNGAEFAQAVKARAPGLPIIMLTAFPPQATPPGIDLILTKPFMLDALRNALAMVVQTVGST